MASPRIDVGTVLASRYRATRLLGAGGMGEVWACFDQDEQRNVAVKAVLPEHVSEPWVRRLLHGEVTAAARLSHPNIVELYDLVEADWGAPLLVMALRPGVPLDDAFESLSWKTTRAVLRQLLHALAHAHARGVLHLDLKPENILVRATPSLQITLLDFGIARVLRPGRSVESWFEDGSVAGTPTFMSPEQWYGQFERIGPWSDLYAVGLILHDLVAGLLPFETSFDDWEAAHKRRLVEPAPPLKPAFAGVPEGAIALCAELLALSPTERPASAAEVLARLDAMEQASAEDTPLPLPAATTRAARAAAVTMADAGAPEEAPPSVPGRVVTPSLVRTGQVSSRWRIVEGLEQAFNAEVAPPSPGAYGLFGLRELPVLGREDERRALWSAVRSAVEHAAPSAVLMSGGAGTGKSRLAADAVERALELGLAVELTTHWSATRAADEGLRGLVENALGSRGRSGKEFDDRLAFFLQRFPGPPATWADEARVLLRPAPDASPDAGLPVRVAAGLVQRVARSTPVILRLDDIHWSAGEATALLHALHAARSAAGERDEAVCVIATERDSEATGDYADALSMFAAGGELVRVPMRPLGEIATQSMIRGLLALSDELAEIVARRCEGNPLFASQLVAQLVRERAVERSGGHYVLARNVALEKVVPTDMAGVWARAVELSGAVEEDLWALALVRDRVSTELLDAIASRSPDHFSSSFTRALASGLLRREGDLFQWSHGLLRDHLVARIDPKRAPELHGRAADALSVLVGREDVDENRAHFLRVARRHPEAHEAMLAAAMWSWRRAERAPRERRLSTLIAWTVASTATTATYARALAELAQYHAEGGQFDKANAAIESAKRALDKSSGSGGVARPRGEMPGRAGRHRSAAAWIGFREGQVMRLQGRVAEGQEASRRGIDAAMEADEGEVHALCLAQLGLDAFRRGDNPEARHFYDQGLALAAKARARSTEAQILFAKSATEEPVSMEESCRAAVAMAREAGALRIELLARVTWTEALFRCGMRDEARAQTAALSAIAKERGLRQTVSMVEAVAACWAVLDEDWPVVDAHHATAVKWGARMGAAPERATIAAVDLARELRACAPDDTGALMERANTLVREGSSYREAHFVEIVTALEKRLRSAGFDHIATIIRALDAIGKAP